MDEILDRLGVSAEQIADFCRRWKIVRFELFGSVLRDDFDAQSDIDVLITFAEGVIRTFSEDLDMETEFAALVGRNVDLVERGLVEKSRNYIRRKRILKSARVLYEAA
jgi:predicted nucleotidyltransferase